METLVSHKATYKHRILWCGIKSGQLSEQKNWEYNATMYFNFNVKP